jgi:hypothetical protein
VRFTNEIFKKHRIPLLGYFVEDSFPHNREGNVMFLEYIFNQQQQFLTGIPRKKKGKLAYIPRDAVSPLTRGHTTVTQPSH